jgi:PAS domain S-box-containing protein
MIALPLLLQAAVTWFYYREAESRLDSEIRLEQSHHLKALSDDVQSEFDHAVDELLFLADQVRLHEALNPDGQREVLGEDFLSFMNTTRLFDQVRLLSASGMELVRANYNNGKPQLVPEPELQDKSERYYFRQARKLAAGSVYISRLDLNMENGRVERPFKPMLRLATPVSDESGNRGVLVLNYRADVILHRLKASERGSEVTLINAAGFALRPGEARQSWKRFLSGNRDDSLARRLPRLWQAMESGGEGAVHLPTGDYYFFDRINAADYVGRPGRLNFPFHPAEYWYLLIHFPADKVAFELRQMRQGILAYDVTGVAIILLLALLAAHNIRRRRQAFALVQASERQLRSIYEQTPLGYLCLDANGIICEMNDAAASIFGHPARQLLGQAIEPFTGYLPDALQPDEVQRQHEFEIGQPDGTTRWIEFRCKSVFDGKGSLHYHCLLSDISGRKTQEQARVQRARLQATEQLSGGVAHLINNYMAIITGNVDLLNERLHGRPDEMKMLARIRDTAFKTSDIANDMLNYSRRGKLPFRRCRSEELLELAVGHAAADPRVRFDIEGTLWPIQGDRPRLVQVLNTLLQNALEATPEEGHIHIMARNRTVSEVQAAAMDGMRAGDYVEIRVEDDGVGLSAEVQEHLFEPFFTTKFQGRGLSLAAAYGIVKLHGGYLYVASEPGKGSVFSVYLPVMQTGNGPARDSGA